MSKASLFIIALYGCTQHTEKPAQESINWANFAVVATVATDYSVGALSAINLDTLEVRDQIAPTTGDSSVRVTDEWVIQLNRFNYDSIRVYPSNDWTIPTTEFSVGSLANPHDAALCEDKLFVSLYGRDYLGIYDITTGHQLGQVDLSEFNDADTTGPEPSSLVRLEDRLYVGLQRLNRSDNWSDAGGMIVEINCEQEVAIRSWEVGANTHIVQSTTPNELLVTAEPYLEESGGLWALVPNQEPALRSLISTQDQITVLGAAGNAEDALIIQVDLDNNYSVQCLNHGQSGLETLIQLDSFATGIRATANGDAWITTRPHWSSPNGNFGIWTANIQSCTLLEDTPIQTQLPPYAIDFVESIP